MNSMQPLVFVHIGKCGGITIQSLLKNNTIKYTSIHINKCKFNPNNRYLIVLRNPIKRFISAFYWRYKLVVDDKKQENRFIGEKEILQHYKTVNALAEDINAFDINKTYIHHIKEDIHYYLEDILKNCTSEHILSVMTTETLDQDCIDLFGCKNHKKENENKNTYDKSLSKTGYDTLKQYLHKDYECITKIYELGFLTDEQYTILMD